MLSLVTARMTEHIGHWRRSVNRFSTPSSTVVSKVAGKNYRRAMEGSSLPALGLIMAIALALVSGPLSAQQPCAPPPAGLVGWWPLDETSGTTVHDRSGLSNTGTASAPIGPNLNPRSVTAFVGGGLQFFMTTHVTVNTSLSLHFGNTGSFTIDAWIKGHGSPIVSNMSGSSGYAVRNDSGTLRFDIAPATSFSGPPTAPINPGVWTFIAVVVDRSTNKVTLYASTSPTGTLQSAVHGPIPPGFNASVGPLTIGGCPGNPNGCDTILDEVEVFNRALQPAEITGIFNANSTGKCKKGMTWLHTASNAQFNTITVGCGPAGPNRCDPIHGDHLCTQQLPLLCILKPNPPYPLPVGLPNNDPNNRWSGGKVATTPPVAASTFPTLAAANAQCASVFGQGWRVAEFHDGQGWNFNAYGTTVSAPMRFWVDINDQAGGSCWTRP